MGQYCDPVTRAMEPAQAYGILPGPANHPACAEKTGTEGHVAHRGMRTDYEF